MNEKKSDDAKPLWLKQAPITIVGVLVLGIVGSTLYDLLVKPGLTSAGRQILDAITFGSVTLKNAAYSSAAIDPTPVTSLVLLQAALAVATLPAIGLVVQSIVKREIDVLKRMSNEENNLGNSEIKQRLELKQNQIAKKLRVLVWLFWLIFLPWISVVLVAFSVHNQSVLVWRAFNANMAILEPHVTREEVLALRAKYAQMETGDAYKAIQDEMSLLANERGAKLKSIQTW